VIPPFDNFTLIVALGLVSLISVTALFINWAANKHVPGLGKIASGFLITTIGILLLTFREVSAPIISVMLANAMLLGGRIPILMGLAEFWIQERTKLTALCTASFIVTMAILFYFTMISDGASQRVVAYTIMNVIFNLGFVFVILRGVQIERKLRPVMSTSAHYGAYLASGLFLANTIGEFALMFLRLDAPFSQAGSGTSLLILGSIFTIVVFSLSIIIMTMEELTVEHKENAIFDPVTTILNHRTFIEVGNRVMGVALRYNKPVSLLTIEVANMNEITGRYGHRVANEMLRHFALRATDQRRNEDVLARSSFKDFHMLLPGVPESGAQIVVEKIRDAVNKGEFVHEDAEIDLDFNVAAITREGEHLNLQQMLVDGDLELARHKHSKRII